MNVLVLFSLLIGISCVVVFKLSLGSLEQVTHSDNKLYQTLVRAFIISMNIQQENSFSGYNRFWSIMYQNRAQNDFSECNFYDCF